ncbi:hypothetical protein Q3G72_007526 [Acer saccharum]|nr:hypothetical protein Q3G72_007526 [Acer saccharum]
MKERPCALSARPSKFTCLNLDKGKDKRAFVVNKDGKVIRKDCGKKTLYKGLGSRPTRPNYGVGLSLVMRLGRLRNAMLERILESDILKGLW